MVFAHVPFKLNMLRAIPSTYIPGRDIMLAAEMIS